jgi:hypothetical protein
MAIRSWSPWGATPRTPRSRETWSPRGEAGRANGQSTAALSAATASSFTGNLRAARCVARQAGSILSGGRSRQLPDGVGLLSGTRSQRRRLHAPSPPAAEESIRYLRPGKAGASLEKGRRRKSSRSSPPPVHSYGKRGRALPRRARPPPAAERGRGGAPSPGGSSVATSLPRSRWSTRTQRTRERGGDSATNWAFRPPSPGCPGQRNPGINSVEEVDAVSGMSCALAVARLLSVDARARKTRRRSSLHD